MLLQTIHSIVLFWETYACEYQGTSGEGRFCFKEIMDSHKTRLAFVIYSFSFFWLTLCFDLLGVDFIGI